MNVGKHGIGEIVVDHKINIFEVDSSSQEISSNQNPVFASIKLTHDTLSLLFGLIAGKCLDSFSLVELLL
jgi:hypothetical protein